MKGNEVLRNIKQFGAEKGMERTLLQLAEEVEEIRETCKEMAKAFEALVRIQTMLNGVADGLQTKLNSMEQRQFGESAVRDGLG